MSAASPPRAQRPIGLTFTDAGVEADYNAYWVSQRWGWIRGGTVFLTLLYAAFGPLDLLIFADVAPTVLAWRYGVAVPLLMIATLAANQARWRWPQRNPQPFLLAMAVCAVAPMLGIGTTIARAATLAQVQVAALGMLLTLSFLYGFSRLRFIYAAPLGAVATAASLMLGRVPSMPDDIWLGLAAFGVATNLMGGFVSWTLERGDRDAFTRQRLIRAAQEQSEALLRNVLPSSIAEQLKHESASGQRRALAERHESVTVICVDLTGFTPMSARMEPDQLAVVLDALFSAFDELAEAHGVEKIKTLGDAWIGAAGVPLPRVDHVAAVANLAIAFDAARAPISARVGETLTLRMGIESGAVVAGVIGRARFAYDVWGEAVDAAKQLEETCIPGRCHVGPRAAAALPGRVMLDEDGAWLVASVALEG